MKGNVVHSSPTIGIKRESIKNANKTYSSIRGQKKAKAILAAELRNTNSVLITDEGAAREIINILENE